MDILKTTGAILTNNKDITGNLQKIILISVDWL